MNELMLTADLGEEEGKARGSYRSHTVKVGRIVFPCETQGTTAAKAEVPSRPGLGRRGGLQAAGSSCSGRPRLVKLLNVQNEYLLHHYKLHIQDI